MFDSKYEDFEYIKTIEDFNEFIDYNNHFHYICNSTCYTIYFIKYCIRNGADFNIKGLNGNTPFHLICNNSSYKLKKEVLEYCLKNGADLTIKNDYGNTPFHRIFHYNKDLFKYCKPYMNEYDFVKTMKEHNLNWKEYV